ncbi:hypothetical protein ACM17_23875, partial [Escherichia coli]|uniref:hypothetical protein n=1 Tax=Escherichia coli TaxID=562 RepID=UPI00066D3250
KKWVILGTTFGKAFPSKDTWAFFARYDQNTVDTLKNTFTQEVNLNGQKMTANNKNITVNGNTTAIELTRNNKNKDLK